jgi:hypothetical protein
MKDDSAASLGHRVSRGNHRGPSPPAPLPHVGEGRPARALADFDEFRQPVREFCNRQPSPTCGRGWRAPASRVRAQMAAAHSPVSPIFHRCLGP